ncbi:MAG: hypothetical protein K2H53_01885 [Clostridia bacterium]|nr:hypothetical protein [Clostridia bacterium]
MSYVKNVTNTFLKNGYELSLLDTKCDKLSICFVSIDGNRNNYCMLDQSTMFYYIIEGEGDFEINKEKIKVRKNDLVEIPPKNKYSYEGKIRMLEIQSQAFDEAEVHEIPKN